VLIKAWPYFLSPPHLLNLAIKKGKIITKQKALARRPDGNEKFPYLTNRYWNNHGQRKKILD